MGNSLKISFYFSDAYVYWFPAFARITLSKYGVTLAKAGV